MTEDQLGSAVASAIGVQLGGDSKVVASNSEKNG